MIQNFIKKILENGDKQPRNETLISSIKGMEEGMLNAISVVVKEWTWLYIFNVLQLQNLSFICLLQEKEKYYNWLGNSRYWEVLSYFLPYLKAFKLLVYALQILTFHSRDRLKLIE